MDDSLDDLMATIANVVHGDTRFSPRVSGSLVRRMEVLASALSIATLTARETQVAELLAEGLSNKEIASCLMIAIPTVKAHVHSILGKLNARRRGEAVARMHPGGVARLRLDPEAQTRAVPAYRRRPGQTGVI
jgi:DNA-binding NarL/FixJ family response regulator